MKDNIGILLINLGSPDSPTTKDVRKYLREFLMDPYVISIPWLFRFVLVYIIISFSRSKKSAKLYKKIWTEQGSPLVVESTKFKNKLSTKLGEKFTVKLAMRYGNPNIAQALAQLQHCTKIICIPLYPQYAESSTKTAFAMVDKIYKRQNYKTQLVKVPFFYNKPQYIDSLSAAITNNLKNKDINHYLFSYHSLPVSHITKIDPSTKSCLTLKDCCRTTTENNIYCYRHHCFETTRLIAEKLNIPQEELSISFQSKLGREEWLTPCTIVKLAELAKNKVENIAVISASFTSDCLETLEELDISGREHYLNNGGKSFNLVPCLNDDDTWVNNFTDMLQEYI